MTKRLVLTDGNGSDLIQVAGLGVYVPLKKFQAAESSRESMASEINQLKLKAADRDKLQDELIDMMNQRDAALAHIEGFYHTLMSAENISKSSKEMISGIYLCMDKAPAQHLAEIRAEAGRAGFVAGAVCARHPLKPNAVEIKESADEYTAKVRKGGEE